MRADADVRACLRARSGLPAMRAELDLGDRLMAPVAVRAADAPLLWIIITCCLAIITGLLTRHGARLPLCPPPRAHLDARGHPLRRTAPGPRRGRRTPTARGARDTPRRRPRQRERERSRPARGAGPASRPSSRSPRLAAPSMPASQRLGSCLGERLGAGRLDRDRLAGGRLGRASSRSRLVSLSCLDGAPSVSSRCLGLALGMPSRLAQQCSTVCASRTAVLACASVQVVAVRSLAIAASLRPART